MEQILFNKIWKEFQQSILSRGSEVVAPLFWLVLTLVYSVRSKRHAKFQVRLFNWVSIASWLIKCPTTVCVKWLVEHLSLHSCSDWVQILFRSPWHHFDDDLFYDKTQDSGPIYKLIPELDFSVPPSFFLLRVFFFFFFNFCVNERF